MTRKGVTVSLVIAVIVGIIALLTGYLSRKDAGAPRETASAPQATSQTAAPASPADAPAAIAPVQAEKPAPAVEQAASPAPAPEPEAPTFDVAGIEADGAAVIAGRAAPGSKVSLLANGEVIGTATANEAGEWSMVLDKPLAPGDYDMLLRMETPDGKTVESKQRLTVSLPGSGKERPLIVLNSPDAPSSVLQQPAAIEVASAEAEPRQEEAKPDAAAVPAPAAAPVSEPAPSAASETPAPDAGTTEPAAAAAPEASPAPAPQATAEAAPETAPEAAPPAAAEQRPEQAPEQAVTAPPPAPAADTAPAADVAPAPAAETPAAEAAPVIAPVTVEAVESEDGKLYVAGTSTVDALLRIYVADALMGETKANGEGRWLLETTADVPVGDVEVRADHVDPATGAVLARAAVSFRKAEPQEIILSKVEEAKPEGAADAGATPQMPNVIIRKGDNLWNISRRLYGTGFRYTTIYQANKDQIRNPDLIYPGQVFLTPDAAPEEAAK